jgi:adenosine deaminase
LREALTGLRALATALPYKQWITAVGLDSSERGNPPSKFAEVFRQARAAGFLAVAHAGEEGPAAYVEEALEVLGVCRIDHGNHALDDPQIVSKLAARRIPLTLCPLSNLKLRVVDDLRDHPLKRMMQRGLLATVNSDDPAYFGGYVNENYRAVAEALSLTREDIVVLAKNSFQASFLAESEKAKMVGHVDGFVQANGQGTRTAKESG